MVEIRKKSVAEVNEKTETTKEEKVKCWRPAYVGLLGGGCFCELGTARRIKTLYNMSLSL